MAVKHWPVPQAGVEEGYQARYGEMVSRAGGAGKMPLALHGPGWPRSVPVLISASVGDENVLSLGYAVL
jgi:hypothetical protein